MREEHYLLDATGQPVPAYRTENTYSISVDKHARTTSYSQPVQIDYFHYHQSDSTYKPLRRTTASYDDFGCPLQTSEYLWDASRNTFVLQQSVVDTYSSASWGGEMLASETFIDHILGNQKLVSHELTSDQRNFISSTTMFRESSASSWSPWKTKLYSYDTYGRITSETVAWSKGIDVPQGSVAQYTYQKSYSFAAGTGILTESRTDPLGGTGSLEYDMRIMRGPLVRKKSPLGVVESLKYDLSGRLIESINALGDVSRTVYLIGPSTNKVQYTNSLGYTTQQSYDALGRAIEIADSGVKGAPGINRILSRTEYNFVSKVVKSTNELGLVATQAYDALGRLVQKTGYIGNVITYAHKDADLVTEERLNGDLRQTIFADGLARTVKAISYGDSGAEPSGYQLVAEVVYDGFGRIRSRRSRQQAADGSGSIILSQKDTELNIEDSPRIVTKMGLSSTLTGTMDKVVREHTYDIFGNSVTYRKVVTYNDGRQFSHDGPISTFDVCNRFVKLKNQLGQSETYVHNADGQVVSISRYDGTVFTYTYDAIGQELSTKSPDGTTSKEWLSNGLLSRVTRGDSTISHAYAIDGSLKSVIYPNGATQSYELDDFSRVTREVDASGRVTVNSFDKFGRLESKTQGGNSIRYRLGTVNHCVGELVGYSVTTPQYSFDRVILYDGYGRKSQAYDSDGYLSIPLNTKYWYDSRGRVVELEVNSTTDMKDSNINYNVSIQYDGLGQLSVERTHYLSGVSPSTKTQSFKYDGNFNILQSAENEVTSNYTYNAIDQRKDAGFVYDTNGRLSADSKGRRYAYDSEDRLLSVTGKTGSTDYQYYANNALSKTSKSKTSSSYYYSSAAVNSVFETDDKTSAWTSYFLHPQGRISAQRGNETPTVFFESHNSIVKTVKGTEVTSFAYDPYGNTADGPPGFGWQQELGDPEEGLVYLRSRFYQSDNRSFLTMDNVRGQENRYSYCNGDPVNASDPTGEAATTGLVAGALVGVAAAALTGGLAAFVGLNVFGIAIAIDGIAASAIAGAAGSIAGDATSAAINGERFTAARAGEDLLIGAVGGVVGAGSGVWRRTRRRGWH